VEVPSTKPPEGCRGVGGDGEQMKKNSNRLEVDSSKLDPLDIDGWRRLVEGEFEKKDYSIHGLK